MVVTLGPGRFYGSGLPRPWFHADVKFSEERVDPPRPVLDPLLFWAREAHWSMGGLSFKRHRLQGRIEGSIKKLRAEAERTARRDNRSDRKKKHQQQPQEDDGRKRKFLASSSSDEEEAEEGDEDPGVGVTPSPRRLRQRRRRVTITDEHTSESDEERTTKQEVAAPKAPSRPRRKSARKLGDEFDRVASSRSPSDAPLPGDAAPSPRTRSGRQTRFPTPLGGRTRS